MEPMLIIASVVALAAIAGMWYATQVGAAKQRAADAESTTNDIATAQEVERKLDALSDDAVDERLLDDWSRPEPLPRGTTDTDRKG